MLKYKDIITTPTKPLLPDITVCTECEHDSALPRIDRKYFLKELNNKWLEKTVHNTILGLFVAPGKVVYQYINYDREQIIKPIAYLLLMSVIFLWSLNQFDKNFDKSLEIASDLKKNMHWIQFIQAIFMAWVMARWTYKDSGYNFYECAVLTTYFSGVHRITGNYIEKSLTFRSCVLTNTLIIYSWTSIHHSWFYIYKPPSFLYN